MLHSRFLLVAFYMVLCWCSSCFAAEFLRPFTWHERFVQTRGSEWLEVERPQRQGSRWVHGSPAWDLALMYRNFSMGNDDLF